MKNPYNANFSATLAESHQEKPGIAPATVIYPGFFLPADTEHPGNRLHVISGLPTCLATSFPNMCISVVLVMRADGAGHRLACFVAN